MVVTEELAFVLGVVALGIYQVVGLVGLSVLGLVLISGAFVQLLGH